MPEIVLLHGGFHGAACWSALIPALAHLGHQALAFDLPIDRADTDLDALALHAVNDIKERGLSDGIVLVGHSMGAAVAARIAILQPIESIIFLCPGLPATNHVEQAENMAATNTDFGEAITIDPDGMAVFLPEAASRIFYHDVPSALRDEALHWMRRQWPSQMTMNYQPMRQFPDTPLSAILSEDDRLLPVAANTALIRGRYGIEPHILPGGHSPFLSRPQHLASLLNTIIF